MSIFLTKQKIKKEWTDYNGHMNVAYYVLIFDQYGSEELMTLFKICLLYTSPSPRDRTRYRMPSSA